MNDKYKLSITIIILIVLISLCIYYSPNSNLKNSSYFLTNFNKNEQFIDHCKLIPDYQIQNLTIFIKDKIVNLLKSFSSNDKLTLEKCSSNSYIPATTDSHLRDELNQITNLLLKKINNQEDFNLVKSTYGDLTVSEDTMGNKHFIYELFIRDVKNCFGFKLIVDLIKFVTKKEVKIRNATAGTIFPYYNIGVPSKDQLIPPPMDVIPTGNDILSTKNIYFEKPDKINYLYINNIDIDNSTLTLSDNTKIDKPVDGGLSDNSLDYIPLVGDHDPFIEPSKVRNKWPKLWSQPKYEKAWPCVPVSQYWNNEGIYYETKEKPTRDCPGYRTSTTQQPLIGQSWPTHGTIPRNCGTNHWLFDPTNASGAVGSGASQPPP